MSPEEIIWFVFMALMVIIFLLRHFADDNKDLKKKNYIHNYISNWFDKNHENLDEKECMGGTFMCLVREIFDTFKIKDTKDKLYYVLTLVLIILFITELWMHILRTLNKSENASHPKFCLLGIRCFM